MRVWFAEDFAADLAQSLAAFPGRVARMNALRRFKYRHLLRIGARDLLGDADLGVTTDELARLADTCLGEAWRMADADARARFGAPRDDAGVETSLAVIGMGKLGGQELNYSSDIDLMFVYGAEGETAGGREGRLSNGEYFGRVGREIIEIIESVTDEGTIFRVDMRLRPEGRVGALALLDRRLPGLPPRAGRAVGAPGAAQGAGVGGGRARRRAVHGAGPRGRLPPRASTRRSCPRSAG